MGRGKSSLLLRQTKLEDSSAYEVDNGQGEGTPFHPAGAIFTRRKNQF